MAEERVRDIEELSAKLTELLGTSGDRVLIGLRFVVERIDRFSIQGYRSEAIVRLMAEGVPEAMELATWYGESWKADRQHWERVDEWMKAEADRRGVPSSWLSREIETDAPREFGSGVSCWGHRR